MKKKRFDVSEKSKIFSIGDVELACQEHFGWTETLNISKLAGGYSNGNFLVEKENQKYLIRFCSSGVEAATKEISLLNLLKNNSVPAQRVLGSSLNSPQKAALILNFIEGLPLEERLEQKDLVSDETFRKIGELLANIHKISFEKAGLFGEKALVKVPFANYCDEGKRFLESALDDISENRLSYTLKSQIRALVADRWHCVDETYTGPVLLHCDFNPKNILVENSGSVTAIDWEFAMSGHHLTDIGNFLRFEEDYNESQRNYFLRGYKSAGGKLSSSWVESSKLLDLISLCFFLNRKEHLPNTFNTSRILIERTIEYFEKGR